MEPVDLWKKGVPEKYREPRRSSLRTNWRRIPAARGGSNPSARIREMEVDGLSAEVLYPTLLLSLYALKDAGLQETCFRLYNDWLIEYCSVAKNRLIGVPAISVYDVDHAVKELERCRKAGLKGALIWQAPHPDLPFHSSHYDKFWAADHEGEPAGSFSTVTSLSFGGAPARRRK